MPPETKFTNVKAIHSFTTHYHFVINPLTTTRYLSIHDSLVPILRISLFPQFDLITCW